MYGKGSYFAKDAVYSVNDRYCPLDGAGVRYIYYCRVLTGQYTVGKDDMIVPPPRDPQNPLIRFDSTVDKIKSPSLFVTYYDTQAYPEYLVSFR